jgi:hypothetical protein
MPETAGHIWLEYRGVHWDTSVESKTVLLRDFVKPEAFLSIFNMSCSVFIVC